MRAASQSAANSSLAQVKREMVFDRADQRLRPIGGALLLTSAPLNWRGILLEERRLPALRARPIMWLSHAVVLHLGAPLTLESTLGPRKRSRRILPGQVSLFPAGTVMADSSTGPVACLSVFLEPGFLSQACREVFGADQFALRLRYGIDDKFIRGVCLALKAEVEQGGRSVKPYYESLATSLAVHLGAKHATRGAAARSSRAIQQAVEFIRGHLVEEISLERLAAAAGVSPFQFTRLFQRNVGVSPSQFVRLLRAT